jgi:hypothetical protein
MATFRTYAEVLRPDHPLMKNKARSTSWSPSRYRSAEIEQAMRAEPGVVLGDVLRQTDGAYETTTRLTPKFREDIAVDPVHGRQRRGPIPAVIDQTSHTAVGEQLHAFTLTQGLEHTPVTHSGAGRSRTAGRTEVGFISWHSSKP